MSDDRFDSFNQAYQKPELSSGYIEPKRLVSCAECFRGFNLIIVGAARYAYACSCPSGQYYQKNGWKTKEYIRINSRDLMKDQLEIWGEWLKKQ